MDVSIELVHRVNEVCWEEGLTPLVSGNFRPWQVFHLYSVNSVNIWEQQLLVCEPLGTGTRTKCKWRYGWDINRVHKLLVCNYQHNSVQNECMVLKVSICG